MQTNFKIEIKQYKIKNPYYKKILIFFSQILSKNLIIIEL